MHILQCYRYVRMCKYRMIRSNLSLGKLFVLDIMQSSVYYARMSLSILPPGGSREDAEEEQLGA
jgi:hypothetical protein